MELDIYWPVLSTVPSMELDVYWSEFSTVPSMELYILNAKNLAPPTFLHFILQIKTFFVILKLSLTYAYNSLNLIVCSSILSFVVLSQ